MEVVQKKSNVRRPEIMEDDLKKKMEDNLKKWKKTSKKIKLKKWKMTSGTIKQINLNWL